jgi:lysophospholipase L1-like esterase
MVLMHNFASLIDRRDGPPVFSSARGLETKFSKDVIMGPSRRIAGLLALISSAALAWSAVYIAPDNITIRYSGRFDARIATSPAFNWPGSSIMARIQGTGCRAILHEDKDSCSFNISIDGAFVRYFIVKAGVDTYAIASGLTNAAHLFEVTQRGEATDHQTVFKGLLLDDGASLQTLPAASDRRIEFIGDSHTAGLGAEGTSNWASCVYSVGNIGASYASLLAKNFGAEAHYIAASGKGLVHNHSDSNQVSATTMAKLVTRTLINDSAFRWNSSSWIPQAVVINLGTNDFAECFQARSETWRKPATGALFKTAYHAFLDSVRTRCPGAKIVCVGPYDDCGCKDSAQKVIKEAYTEEIQLGKTDIAYVAYPKFAAGDYVCCHPGTAYHRKLADSLTAAIAALTQWSPAGVRTKQSFADNASVRVSALSTGAILVQFAAESPRTILVFDSLGKQIAEIDVGKRNEIRIVGEQIHEGNYAIKAIFSTGRTVSRKVVLR